MTRRLLLVLMLVSFPACTFFAQPPPGWSRDIEFTADAILDKAIEEQGEEKAAQQATDLMASVTVRRHDVQPTVELSHILLWQVPNSWSVETRQPGQPSVKVIGRGSRGVEVIDGVVTRRDVSVTEVPVDRFLRHVFLLKFFRGGAGEPAEIEETVVREDGGQTIRIHKFDGMGRKWLLSLDAKTFEPIAVREWIEVSEEEFAPLDTFVDGWIPDQFGNRVPRLLRSYVGGELVQELEVKDLSWNRGLREADFKVP